MIVRLFPISGIALAMAALVQPAEAAPAPAATFEQTATVQLAEGRAELSAAVTCFRAEARMPSFAHVASYPDDGEAVYRLRFDGLMFETIRFVRTAAGTRAEIRLAASLSRAERAHFAAVRGAVLARCLNRSTAFVEGGGAQVEAGL